VGVHCECMCCLYVLFMSSLVCIMSVNACILVFMNVLVMLMVNVCENILCECIY
jgi:hypothetical protein